MNDTEFSEFLKRLDADLMSWKARLAAVDLSALRLPANDARELRRSYSLCLLALENTRGDISQLTARQTLKRDFLLLVDLNALARSLDRLGGGLASPASPGATRTAQKSLVWAREVLSIDAALAAHSTTIERHVLALAGVLDAALDGAEARSSRAPQRR